MTLNELAGRSGVSRAMIGRVERAQSSATAALLGKLCAALDVSLSANPEQFNIHLKLLRTILEKNRDSLKEFAVLCFNSALMLGYSAGWLSYGGLAARLLEGSDRKAGLYLLGREPPAVDSGGRQPDLQRQRRG